jgi:hypothetical protein
MKYFTIKWWQGEVRNQMAANDKYCRYMESIESSLPSELKRLHWEVSLHDSHLRRLHFSDGTLELRLDGERIDKGKYSSGSRKFRLTYRDVRSLISTGDPKQGLAGPYGYGDLGYDEIEVLTAGLFEHRILFSSGIELQVRFADFTLYYDDHAS